MSYLEHEECQAFDAKIPTSIIRVDPQLLPATELVIKTFRNGPFKSWEKCYTATDYRPIFHTKSNPVT